jgi:dimethylargininase
LREYRDIRRIELPATIDGGDVLRVGKTLLIGLSARTNAAAVEAVSKIISPLGYRVVAAPVRECLHLKSAVTALPDGRLLLNPAWVEMSALEGMPYVAFPTEEPDAANVALVGEAVCASSAHPQTIEMIRNLGFDVREIELTEFAKAEGCVTCMSLLFEK